MWSCESFFSLPGMAAMCFCWKVLCFLLLLFGYRGYLALLSGLVSVSKPYVCWMKMFLLRFSSDPLEKKDDASDGAIQSNSSVIWASFNLKDRQHLLNTQIQFKDKTLSFSRRSDQATQLHVMYIEFIIGFDVICCTKAAGSFIMIKKKTLFSSTWKLWSSLLSLTWQYHNENESLCVACGLLAAPPANVKC